MVKPSYRINQNIKAKEIRLIDQKGKQLGVVKTAEALKTAERRGLDLVEVAPSAKPPVAKLFNFQKFLLEQKKRGKIAKKRGVKTELKEIRIKPNIGEADLNVRAKRAEGFLKEGDRVKLTVVYRGREITHPEVGLEKINKLIEMLKEGARVGEGPTRRGRAMEALLIPRKGNRSPDEPPLQSDVKNKN